MKWDLCHSRRIIWVAFFGLLLTILVQNTLGAISGWKKTPTQYHIQTDEGSERYFRYQTYNGQYRKERRLDDGTVIGSYGWVDPSGYLRMTDYIADSKGYRVVKELMEYVGTNSILETPETEKTPPKYSPSNKHSTRVEKPVGMVFATPSPSPLPSTSQQLYETYPSSQTYTAKTTPIPYVSKTKTSPVILVYGPTKTKLANQSPNGYIRGNSRYLSRRPNNSGAALELINKEVQESTKEGATSEKDVFDKYTTPLKKNKSSGFIYKIPNQYHKEETARDGSRQGSFGYVDPFGIRRVIHYDTSSGGFKATRDFKYVGRRQ